jgi:hypothetical protein
MAARKPKTREQKLFVRSRAEINGLVWLAYDADGFALFTGVPSNEVNALLADVKQVREWFDALEQAAASIAEVA